MSETKHTPGPWEWAEEHGYYYLVGANGVRVHSDGSACGEYVPDIDVTGPDARLIAAAPTMYEALWAILYADQDNHIPDELYERARAAIAKATGEES